MGTARFRISQRSLTSPRRSAASGRASRSCHRGLRAKDDGAGARWRLRPRVVLDPAVTLRTRSGFRMAGPADDRLRASRGSKPKGGSMSRAGFSNGGSRQRRDRLIRERNHDPYKPKAKLREPTVCTECAATFREGRWTWSAAPADAYRQLCPACQRIRDDYPAGTLRLEGEFLAGHESDILGLIRNVEEREKKDHPLKRIMEIQGDDDGVTVTTTDPHLARTMGEAVQHAYQGDLDFRYADGESLLRASWRR